MAHSGLRDLESVSRLFAVPRAGRMPRARSAGRSIRAPPTRVAPLLSLEAVSLSFHRRTRGVLSTPPALWAARIWRLSARRRPAWRIVHTLLPTANAARATWRHVRAHRQGAWRARLNRNVRPSSSSSSSSSSLRTTAQLSLATALPAVPVGSGLSPPPCFLSARWSCRSAGLSAAWPRRCAGFAPRPSLRSARA